MGVLRLVFVALFPLLMFGASSASQGTITGTVKDPSGAVIPEAVVRIHNPIASHDRAAKTDSNGQFQIVGVPLNSYHVAVEKQGFEAYENDINVRSSVPVSLSITLQLSGAATSVHVEAYGADVLENVPYTNYDADRQAFSRLPVHSPGSGLSDAITMFTPGVVADSNGFFHPLGDHAQASFVIDGQPVTDQQSKQFSTQIPPNALQSMELIVGGVNAEYGDKTSMVVNAQTRSGLDSDQPHGSFAVQYGSFGTLSEEAGIGFGSKRFGNYLVVNTLRSGRFLDTPEFRPYHAIGNNGVIFDRIDFRPSDKHAFNLNIFGARNWFQIPNTLDQPVQDQRQKTETFSFNGGYTNTYSSRSVWSANIWTRQDRVNYYPSRDFEADTPATMYQNRHLTNYGGRLDASHVQGVHNIKSGISFSQTLLKENFRIGITDPSLVEENPALEPYLLTAGGNPLQFFQTGKVSQIAWYAQDTMTFGNLAINIGARFDHYDGPSHANVLQPRAGFSYHFRKTGTVIRGAYSYTLETPYNENLLLASATSTGTIAAFGAFSGSPIQPGRRNQLNGGIQQALGRWIQVDVDFFWKRTENAYDFAALFDTPIFFPISWNLSKIQGVSARVATANIKGFQAYTLFGNSRARFFPPANGGLLFNSPLEDTNVFRIDHDQKFQQTTFARYQYKNGPWAAFTWRYDSGLVAGAVSSLDDALALTGAQQAAMGFFCGGVYATPSSPITECSGPYGATRLNIPAPGTADPDHNPPRIAPRHLFNFSVGTDNLFNRERYRTTLKFTVVNATNKVALYNFQSTFAGTHFVSPRSYIAEIGFQF